jgi:hypothetical protein
MPALLVVLSNDAQVRFWKDEFRKATFHTNDQLGENKE